jgi:sortase A
MMLRRLQYALWGIAIVALGVYAASIGERWASQAYLHWEFAQALQAPARPEPPKHNILGGAQPLGRLEIPSIGFSALFVEGDDNRTLRRAVGHIPGTAAPGSSGNVGLSAHRDTFFRHLNEIREGDVIWITTLNGRFEYVVESSRIVNPDERAVLRNVGHPTLTLVTSYPFYYLGAAPKRFVVHALLVDETGTAE